MKTKIYIFILLYISLTSCKINHKVSGLKEGKWISYDTLNDEIYKYVEKYKKGIEVKTWKTFKNKKLYKKEVYLKDKCDVTYYNENRRIVVRGQTKSEITEKEIHWFYYGDWKHYDENGKLTMIKNYINGELISEKEIK